MRNKIVYLSLISITNFVLKILDDFLSRVNHHLFFIVVNIVIFVK